MKRPLLITIDGDGLLWETRFNRRKAGDVFFEKIITKYPFPFTCSVIAGDIAHSTDKADMGLARAILNSANVEAASHSWSHPHDWRASGIDHAQEIGCSIDFINQKILAGGKKVKVFLWTGLCNPSEEAMDIVDQAGVSNLNGNAIKEPYTDVGGHRQFMSRAYPDWHYMNIKAAWSAPLSPEMGLVLYSHNGDFGGYKEIIRFFESNQLPIHLWLHWYSAIRSDSLDAIRYVLDWCLKQNAEPVFASDYINNYAKKGGN